ncbi:unnamed protein product [Urochloa humidicola]
MCESASLLAAASNHDGQHQVETKATETNTGELDVPPRPTPETLGPTPPLPSPSPAFIYYEDDFRYCYDDDRHLQDQEEDDGADKLLEDDDGADADQPLEDDAPPPAAAAAEERASATGSFAAKLAGFARQKLAEVNTPRAAMVGLGLVGGAVGVYFMLPAAAAVAAAGATMKAPGAAGFLISRAAFAANPQLYFQILRTAGAAAAAAAFAL